MYMIYNLRTCLLSPPYEADSCLQEPDSDWVEDLVPEEDDSMAEDSVSLLFICTYC